mmetsp:Transcript_36271/g.116186  ORF Transcript_36271/g.116186 Transcript_36271/m.116186 type:complete len:365 (+) Transcript_36271:23-1117(+)
MRFVPDDEDEKPISVEPSPSSSSSLPPPCPSSQQIGEVVGVMALCGLLLLAVLSPEDAASRYDQLESVVIFKYFSVTDVFGSLVACDSCRRSLRKGSSWIESLLVSFFLQFGGTTLVGVFLGQPPSWLCGHNACRSLLLAWWLTFQWGFSLDRRGLRPLCSVGAALSSGHAITSWGADKALNAQHPVARQATFLVVLCGCLGASGGSIFGASYFPSEQRDTAARAAVKKAFLGSLTYYVLKDPHDLIMPPILLQCTRPYAKLAMGLYSLLACANSQLRLSAFNPVSALDNLLCSLCLISPTTTGGEAASSFTNCKTVPFSSSSSKAAGGASVTTTTTTTTKKGKGGKNAASDHVIELTPFFTCK